MPSWEEHKVIKYFDNEDARCYMDGGFSVSTYNRFMSKIYNSDKKADCYEKTYVINCGSYDGESIDIFDLQEWFDNNREWIDSLKAGIADD